MQTFGGEYSEAKLWGETDLAIDFYFPDDRTAVEVAGMLGAPNFEYENEPATAYGPRLLGSKAANPAAILGHSTPKSVKMAGANRIARAAIIKR